MSASIRERMVTRTQQLLEGCGMSQCIIDPMRDLVVYLGIIKAVQREPRRENLLNPESYVEEYSWIQYQFLQNQGPINEIISPLEYASSQPSMQKTSRRDSQSPHTVSTLDESEHYSSPEIKSSPSLTHTPPPITVPSFSNPLDTIMRIAGILYTERILPEPAAADPYSSLFYVLDRHVRTVVVLLQSGWSSSPLGPKEYLRPVLIWACLTACAMARLIELEPIFKYEPLDLSPYEDCLAALGLGSAATVDSLPESDFELCNMLSTTYMDGIYTDDRTALKNTLRRYENRQTMSNMGASAPHVIRI